MRGDIRLIQIRAAFLRALEAHLVAPLIDLLMISGEENRRDAAVLVDLRARVLRVFEKPVGEALDLMGGILIQDAVDEARDGIILSAGSSPPVRI